MKYWLVKTEPSVYSIDDLARDQRTVWSGVRNYQARNFLRAMKCKDTLLIYHSNAEPSGIVGVAEVLAEDKPDPTQFDPASEYFDAKSTKEAPRWFCPEVAIVRKLSRQVSLDELRNNLSLQGLLLLQKGSRLSVIPVSAGHFHAIIAMGSKDRER